MIENDFFFHVRQFHSCFHCFPFHFISNFLKVDIGVIKVHQYFYLPLKRHLMVFQDKEAICPHKISYIFELCLLLQFFLFFNQLDASLIRLIICSLLCYF